MITNSKTSAPFVPTDKLEMLALELFNGALPKLPVDGVKRRCQLAKEFSGAHLSIPGFAEPDAAKLAALTQSFRAIAENRQRRVNSFLAALPPPRLSPTQVRAQLVRAIGERGLKVSLLKARHQVAACLVLLDKLEGVEPRPTTNVEQELARRLDAAMPGARASYYPNGNLAHVFHGLRLLADLSDAVLSVRDPSSVATTTSPAPRASAATVPKPATVASLAAAIRSEPDATTRAQLYQQFTALSDKS